tara:strand:- start:24365 stop:24856 length:492 start_codon:yes stop_codon:yes gene_type:complete
MLRLLWKLVSLRPLLLFWPIAIVLLSSLALRGVLSDEEHSKASSSAASCSIAIPYQAPRISPHYEEVLSLTRDVGSYYLAYGQAVRWDLLFDVEVQAEGMLRLSNFVDAQSGALSWKPRQIRYYIDAGDHLVGKERFACRLTLSETPDGEPGPVELYAHPIGN